MRIIDKLTTYLVETKFESLPPEVVEGTLSRYREAYRLLTGSDVVPAAASD